MNDCHHQTLPEKKRKDIFSGGVFPNEEGAEESAKSIRGEDSEDADGADKEDLMVRKPDIGKFVSPADHKAKPQRAKESTKVHEGNMDIEEQTNQQSSHHAGLT